MVVRADTYHGAEGLWLFTIHDSQIHDITPSQALCAVSPL